MAAQRPLGSYARDSYGCTTGRVLTSAPARDLAGVADSIAAEAEGRAATSTTEQVDMLTAAAYALAVRDTLLWLTGEDATPMLTQTLDL